MTYIRPAHLWRIETKPAELERERTAALKRINRERANVGLEPLAVGPIESVKITSRKVNCEICFNEYRTTARRDFQKQHVCRKCGLQQARAA